MQQLKSEMALLGQTNELVKKDKAVAEDRVIAYKKEIELLQVSSQEREKAREQGGNKIYPLYHPPVNSAIVSPVRMLKNAETMTAELAHRDACAQVSEVNINECVCAEMK
eukprot:376735-Hanusia_phi.AAC.1